MLEEKQRICLMKAKEIKIEFDYDGFRKDVSEAFGLGIPRTK